MAILGAMAPACFLAAQCGGASVSNGGGGRDRPVLIAVRKSSTRFSCGLCGRFSGRATVGKVRHFSGKNAAWNKRGREIHANVHNAGKVKGAEGEDDEDDEDEDEEEEKPPPPPPVTSKRARAKRPKPAEMAEHILFQGFNWESYSKKPWYKDLKGKVPVLAAAGITDVWLPPPSQSVDKQGYLPSQLYDLNSSSYGNELELKQLIDAMHELGICSIADIVINHRSGWKQDEKGYWNVFEGGTPDKRLDWGSWAVVCNDIYKSGGKGKQDTGESYGAAPDLDHTNKQVQDELTDWMNWMKAEIGFDGWRFDFVKGYAPKYTKLYCERTEPTFVVGELWTSLNYVSGRLAADQNFHRQQLCDWINGTGGVSCVFDFTTKGVLQEAVNNEYWRLRDKEGRCPGLIGWYPLKAVTFVDNHDTGSTQRHWNFPDAKVHLGYVYILTHPGIPCIFYDHYFYWGMREKIDLLLDLRKRNGITAVSKINILVADYDLYIANIADRLIVKMGPRLDMGSLLPKKNAWKIAISGSEYCIWENSKRPSERPEPELDPATEVIVVKSGHSESDAKVEVNINTEMPCDTVKRIMEEAPDIVTNPPEAEKIAEGCQARYDDDDEEKEDGKW